MKRLKKQSKLTVRKMPRSPCHICPRTKPITRYVIHKKKKEYKNFKSFSFKVLPSIVETFHSNEVSTLVQSLSLLAETEATLTGLEWTLLLIHIVNKRRNRMK